MLDKNPDDAIIEVGLKPLIISKQQNMIKRVLRWILVSSADPRYTSLTVKAVVTFALLFGISEADSESLSGAINDILLAVSMLASGVAALYGLYRKLKLTFRL